MTNFVLSKTPLGALHWRVRFRTTVTYRPSTFEYSLDYQHVVRSSGNRDIRHFRPILLVLPSPIHPYSLSLSLPLCLPRAPGRTNFTLDNSARFAGLSVEIQSAKFLRLSYSSVRNKWTRAARRIVSTIRIADGTRK